MSEAEKELIVKALKTLKETCLSYQGTKTDYPDPEKCSDCPLGYGWGCCQLTEIYPLKYDINDANAIWRALL